MASSGGVAGSSSGGKSSLSSSQKLSSAGLKSSSGLLSGSLTGKTGGSAKSFSSSSGGSMKQGSLGSELGRARDKARFKSGDKSFAAGKAGDLRKPGAGPGQLGESDGEKAFKLLAAQASSMGGLTSLPGLPAQLVVEGLIKQLDTNFQIPKLSARANANASANAEDKRSVDKVDSAGKDGPGKSQMMPGQGKIEDAHSSSNSIVNYGQAGQAHGSDVPTNLSMQPDDNMAMKAEMAGSRTFLAEAKDAVEALGASKQAYSMGGDASGNESLNLSKTADKYKPDDKDQHQSFHRVSHADKKLVSYQ